MGVLWCVGLFILFVGLFCREVKLDQKRFERKRKLDNEHILKEVERFVRERLQSS